MRSKSNTKRLSLLLWMFTLVPILIVIIVEANKRILIGYMRIVDFIDLTVTAPFLLVISLAIHATIFSEKRSGKIYWFLLVLIGVFIYGHSMHVTANSINTYSTEIKDYRSIIPGDTYSLIYFLDEDLGHWLLYIGLFGALGLWTYENTIEVQKYSNVLICGALCGIAYSIAFIESSQVWLGPIIALWLVSCSIVSARKKEMSFYIMWRSNLMTQFSIMIALFILIGLIGYYLITGGFIEPSQYNL
jgi:hypothetical protein